MLTPVLVDPGLVAVVIEPVHGVAMLLGIGLVINGLTPAFPNSVAPSGIVPPFSLNVEIRPGVDSGEAMPAEETAGEGRVQLDMPVIPPAEATPPPSNGEIVPLADGIPLTPEIPVIPAVPLMPEDEEPLALQLRPGSGLKPPPSISVAPSGIPVLVNPPGAAEPSIPSGEVAIAGPVGVCAPTVPQPTSMASIETERIRIRTS